MKMIWNKGNIRTGVKALYIHGVITFNPKNTDFAMARGNTKSNYPNDPINIYSQLNREVLNFETEYVSYDGNEIKIYSIERLYVELDIFPLENTIKTQAIRNLERLCDPTKVKKIFKYMLKTGKRKINKDRIEKYLQKNLLDIKSKIQNSAFDNGDVLREYIISLLGKENIPILLKGDSAVELYSYIKRSTQDIDSHIGTDDKNSLEKVFNILRDDSNDVYFKFYDVKTNKEVKKWDEIEKIFDAYIKKIHKFILKSYSRKSSLKEEINGKETEITFNRWISTSDIQKIINDLEISKRPLKIFPTQSCYVFSREMLLAEKFQSLISKPETTTRTKDLVDIFMLWDENINEKDLIKWFYRKFKNQRNSKTQKEALEIINNNKNKELILIKTNFLEAGKMYDQIIDYTDAKNVYDQIIDIFLKQ